MENQNEIRERKKVVDGALPGFSPVSSPRIFWKSRKRSASGRNLDKLTEDNANETPNKQEEPMSTEEKVQESAAISELSERRKALFEPLDPIMDINGRRPSAESLLPPPDFDSTSYPRGWLIGKKRKLVNVDVVESMRKIAIQEMNRKVLFPNPHLVFNRRLHARRHIEREMMDVMTAATQNDPSVFYTSQDREIDGLNQQLEEDAQCLEHLQLQLLQERSKRTEIDGLNQQLEEDAQCLEHLQLQLLQERSKRTEIERENTMLQEQISMLMNMIQDESMGDEGPDEP